MSAMQQAALTGSLVDEPHDRTRNFRNAPRCGARNRAGLPCGEPAMKGRARCRLHGGKSQGPTTKAGLSRSKAARLTHGLYSQETAHERDEVRNLIALAKSTLAAYDVDGGNPVQRPEDERFWAAWNRSENLWSLYNAMMAKVTAKLSEQPVKSDTPEANARSAVRVAQWARLAGVLDELAKAALRGPDQPQCGQYK